MEKGHGTSVGADSWWWKYSTSNTHPSAEAVDEFGGCLRAAPSMEKMKTVYFFKGPDPVHDEFGGSLKVPPTGGPIYISEGPSTSP